MCDYLIIKFEDKPEFLYNVVGGHELRKGSPATLDRSVGICGTFFTLSDNGSYTGLVTAGHGLSVNNTLKYGNNTSTLGTVKEVVCNNGSTGDFAFIQKTDTNATLTNKVHTGSSDLSITGTRYSIPAGTSFGKYGTTTSYGAGYVDVVDVSQTIWNPFTGSYNTIHGLTKGNLYSGYTVAGGDSGGPIFVGNDFVGIITAGTSTTVWFTPYLWFYGLFTAKTS